MKRKREDKKRNPVVLTSVTFICCILFLSVGFSKFSSRLNINGIGATVRLKKDVRISGISLKETKSNAISMSEDYNVNSILTEIKLPNNDSEITYNIDILNLGNAFVALRDISGLPSNLSYEINNYNLKDKLCDDNNNDECNLGSSTTLQLTIKYKENGFDEENITYPLSLNFDFKKIFSITYKDITDNDYPNTILEGETKEIDFVDDIPVGVVVSGVGSYNYNSPKLILKNPTKDVIVYRKYLINYVLNGGVQASHQPTTIATNESVTLLDSTKDDFHFTGWFDNAELSGQSIKILSGVDHDITLYAGWNKYDYYLDEATFDGTSDSVINTGVKLYSEENVNKNFSLKFTIDSYDESYENPDNIINNKTPPTIVSSMDESGSPWPGLVYRFSKNSNETFYSMKINDSHVSSFLSDYSLTAPIDVEIVRENGKIYTKINSNKYTKVLEYGSEIDTFDVPITLGGNISETGVYDRFFKGKLSNISVEFYSDTRLENEFTYKETKKDDLYILDGTIEFDGTNFINTGINLFSDENINKDFEITFNLESVGTNAAQATIVNLKDERQNNVWPGVAYRIKTAKTLEFSARWPGETAVTITNNSTIPQTIHIYRINGVMYYSNGDSEKIKLINTPTDTLTNPINCNLTFGASTKDGKPFRYFKGVVSDIVVNLY